MNSKLPISAVMVMLFMVKLLPQVFVAVNVALKSTRRSARRMGSSTLVSC